MAGGGDTKGRILDAAEMVVLRDGVARLTLDGAASEAGLSKGGVLYHFPSRDALVSAMVERLIDRFNRDLEVARRHDEGAGAATRAYVRATFRPAPGPEREHEDRLGAALIAAVAAEPGLLAPLQAEFGRWQAEIEADGLDPARATLLRLAADGLWLSELFGFGPPAPALRLRLEQELENLTRDDA